MYQLWQLIYLVWLESVRGTYGEPNRRIAVEAKKLKSKKPKFRLCFDLSEENGHE